MAEPVGAGGPVVVDTGSERHLKKSLGYWQLTAVGFSGIIGSGWLLGAMGAAQIAGPESLVSWVIGAVVLALIALVMGSLGGARPEAGGLVRWPFYSNGRFVGTRLSPPCWAWRPGGGRPQRHPAPGGEPSAGTCARNGRLTFMLIAAVVY